VREYVLSQPKEMHIQKKVEENIRRIMKGIGGEKRAQERGGRKQEAAANARNNLKQERSLSQ
jgi:hypothetical protein